MALRLPEPRRPDRRHASSTRRDLLVATVAALLLIMFFLRVVLILVEVQPWIISWRLVELATLPLVWPLQLVEFFNQNIVGELTIADLTAFAIVAILALYLVASLTVRREW